MSGTVVQKAFPVEPFLPKVVSSFLGGVSTLGPSDLKILTLTSALRFPRLPKPSGRRCADFRLNLVNPLNITYGPRSGSYYQAMGGNAPFAIKLYALQESPTRNARCRKKGIV